MCTSIEATHADVLATEQRCQEKQAKRDKCTHVKATGTRVYTWVHATF
ncbi:MAG: hypothetical protein IPK82_20615 [Polyangiaceae bacterium]|nr:hypothetical protein [Polyangiaceae bacterium]